MKIPTVPSELRSLILFVLGKGNPGNLAVLIDNVLDLGKSSLLRTINNVLARPEVITRLIRAVMNNPEYWQELLENSYRHENGFHKIVLLSGRYFKLRLHHFGATAKVPMENIHDHRWAFASSILSGELKMDIFQRTDVEFATEELHHFIYRADKTKGSYGTDLVGKAYLEKIESRIYYPGDSYLMRTDELHRIVNKEGDESITLILTGKPIAKECNLYARSPVLEEEKKLSHYEEKELSKMLDVIMEKIYPQKN